MYKTSHQSAPDNNGSDRHVSLSSLVPVAPAPAVALGTGTTPTGTSPRFQTESLDLASFLITAGFPLLSVDTSDTVYQFQFPGEAVNRIAAYFQDTAVPARALLAARARLQAMVLGLRGKRTTGEVSHVR